jgi:hypothetical protein
MKKIILTSVIGMALLTLTSCSKEELVDCSQAQANYEQEVRRAGTNAQQISLIYQKYKQKYPSCSF